MSATTGEAVETRPESHSYTIFMLVLTVFSLLIMALLLLPLNEATISALTAFDNFICVIFLADFGINLARSHPKRDYFITQRGWLDLLGSFPALVGFPATALLRLARLSRLIRIRRMLSGSNRRRLIRDVLQNRGQYAGFITVLSAFLVISVATLLVIQLESGAPDANITTGGDALWWAMVTITTVGYGDQFPVTALGRLVAVFVMVAGVGIIGSLASILASLLVPQPEPEEQGSEPGSAAAAMAEELASIRAELAALRQALSDGNR
jgi:voltage-gated potassium channel